MNFLLLVIATCIFFAFSYASNDLNGNIHSEWQTTVIKDAEPTYTAEGENFVHLVLLVRENMYKRPNEKVIALVDKFAEQAGLIKECKRKLCFLVYKDRDIIITSEYIIIHTDGGGTVRKISNLDHAVKAIYK